MGEYVVELETTDFETLLKPERVDHPEPPTNTSVIRYRETNGGTRTGRWLIVLCRWTNGKLELGWPPLAITNDCKYGVIEQHVP